MNFNHTNCIGAAVLVTLFLPVAGCFNKSSEQEKPSEQELERGGKPGRRRLSADAVVPIDSKTEAAAVPLDIKLRKGVDFDALPAPATATTAQPASTPAAVPDPAAAPVVASGTYIHSPMVGTFYRSSGPGGQGVKIGRAVV